MMYFIYPCEPPKYLILQIEALTKVAKHHNELEVKFVQKLESNLDKVISQIYVNSNTAVEK